MPGELGQLQRLLARERPIAVELHHMVGHHPAVLELITGLRVPYDVHVHDYAWLCGRVALVGPRAALLRRARQLRSARRASPMPAT